MPNGSKLFSEGDKKVAIELWKAEEHIHHQPGAFEEGDPDAVGHQDGGLRLPQEAGGVYSLRDSKR
jgi:hypothetical protein